MTARQPSIRVLGEMTSPPLPLEAHGLGLIKLLPYCFSAETLGLSLSGTGLAQGRFLLSDCSRSVGIDKSACAECSRSIELVRRSDPGSIPEPIRDRSAKPTTSDGRLTKNHSAKPITPTIN